MKLLLLLLFQSFLLLRLKLSKWEFKKVLIALNCSSFLAFLFTIMDVRKWNWKDDKSGWKWLDSRFCFVSAVNIQRGVLSGSIGFYASTKGKWSTWADHVFSLFMFALSFSILLVYLSCHRSTNNEFLFSSFFSTMHWKEYLALQDAFSLHRWGEVRWN